MTTKPELLLSISTEIEGAARKVIAAALTYEQLTNCGRKFGVTGEVGEILVCKSLGLKLVKDPRAEGFDAVDSKGNRIQIKTRRGENTELPKVTGRLSRFSDHEFDYALLGILNRNYELVEIWKADCKDLWPIICKNKRANPTIRQFKSTGCQVYP